MNTEEAKIRTRDDLVSEIERGLRVKFLFFWGHREKAEGIVDKSCFSQWLPASFEVDGIAYPTAEHFMMAEKARLFGDVEIEKKVLLSTDPHHAKKLGRQVADYDDEAWKAHRFGAVVKGNMAKFTQNSEMGDFLRTTGDRVLVEAAPRDCIWGIGLGAQNPKAENPSQWRGQNLLGFALMEVRELI